MALVTNSPGLSLGRLIISPLLYLFHSWWEIPYWISLTCWCCTHSSSKAISLTSTFFLVFEYIICATATGNGGSFVMQCLAFSADPRRCFTELNLISWDMLAATRDFSFDISLALLSSIIWIICTWSNGKESLWRLRVDHHRKLACSGTVVFEGCVQLEWLWCHRHECCCYMP